MHQERLGCGGLCTTLTQGKQHCTVRWQTAGRKHIEAASHEHASGNGPLPRFRHQLSARRVDSPRVLAEEGRALQPLTRLPFRIAV
jgi:hypothetical protein